MKSDRFSRALIACLSISLGGCAYVNVVPLRPGDRVTHGLRVFEVKPILVVGQTVDIKFVPNTSKAYAVRFGAFLAKNDFSIQIENGMVKQLDANLDSTDFISLLKTLAERLIPPATGGQTTSEGQSRAPAQVFEFVFDDAGNLVALKPVPFIGGLAYAPPPDQSPPSGGTVPEDG